MASPLMSSLYFYPRSPCGERQRADSLAHAPPEISIHALLAESDVMDTLILANAMLFLSTLSLRRATVTFLFYNNQRQDFYPRSPCGERRNGYPHTRQRDAISIHALLAESDRSNQSIISQADDFYPRSPCGERLHTCQYFFSNS